MEQIIHILRATPGDFLAIADLDARAWDGVDARIPDREHTWRIWCEFADVWIAWIGTAEGAIGDVLLCFPGKEDVDVLHKVFVDPAYRGRGIGSHLLEAFTEHAQRSAILTVDPANSRALGVYQRLGFTIDKLVRGFYRSNEDRYVMTWSVSHGSLRSH